MDRESYHQTNSHKLRRMHNVSPTSSGTPLIYLDIGDIMRVSDLPSSVTCYSRYTHQPATLVGHEPIRTLKSRCHSKA